MAKQTHREFDRERYYQLLAIGKKQLGWDEEFYRGIWLPQQGAVPDGERRYSASSLSNTQLWHAVEEMKRLGFRPQAKQPNRNRASDRALADDAQSKKIRALWLSLHADGKVRNPSESSLHAYVHRQTGVEALQWLSMEQAARVIEALKKWQKRPGKRG